MSKKAELTKEWASKAPTEFVDRRRWSSDLEQWAIEQGVWVKDTHAGRERLRWKERQDDGVQFDPVYALTGEELFDLLRTAGLFSEEVQGKSIWNEQGWKVLGILPDNHKWAGEHDHKVKFSALRKLSVWGLIRFQSRGSLVQITLA